MAYCSPTLISLDSSSDLKGFSSNYEDKSPPPLVIGERVVYLRGDNPEFGSVKWIGRLPGYTDIMAGVEFENPIGSGSGYYNGKRVFEARMNHAALVPIVGLIRAVDYQRDNTDFGGIRKDLLMDFEDAGTDTTIWTANIADDAFFKFPTLSSNTLDQTLTLESPESNQSVNPRGFQVGSSVEVKLYPNITSAALTFHGIIRWIGKLPDKEAIMAGVELEEHPPYWVRCCSDGTYRNLRYFYSNNGRGVFVELASLSPDFRTFVKVDTYQTGSKIGSHQNGATEESKLPCPWKLCDLGVLFGKPKGIQGKQNSCYLDATLFALFTATDSFDGLLIRPKNGADGKFYDEIRTCLKNEIVTPLRRFGYVSSDSVMRLRRLLSHALPGIDGWTTDEEDPEELINLLFGKILRADPDVHLTTGQKSQMCQLVVDDAFPKTALTSVQTLLERSFFCSNVMLESVPDRFIVQLPRYGKQKLYDYIVPTLELDLSNILANRPRRCGSCGKPARWQCKECYLTQVNDYALSFFCCICCSKFHSAQRYGNDHELISVTGPYGGAGNEDTRMELASVICIESSHYVSFVRVRDGQNARWVFFDSMADREGGEITGYNLPQVRECDEYFDYLLMPKHRPLLVDALPLLGNRSGGRYRERLASNPLPDYIERLLQDCYICIYTKP